MSMFRLKHYLKTSLWFVPLLFMFGAAGVHLITTAIDPRGELVPQSISGDPDAASQILYLISFAMLTLTGLVLSLLVLVVQLAMGSFSPRIVRQILQDRPSQCVIGLFAGTFIHGILTLRLVKTTEEQSVPGLAVAVALAAVLTCMATLVWYLNHIGQSLRAAALVGWVENDTVKTLDRIYPPAEREPDPADLITATPGGVIFNIDHQKLVRQAQRADCRLDLLWSVGDFVPSGSDLVAVQGDPAGLSRRKVLACLALGPERTLNQDVAYGLRMLVDIAERTLSGGPFEDPTTTVQAIDRIHEILRQIVTRPLHDGIYRDDQDVVRLTVPTMVWGGYVRIAFDEIRQVGAGSPQVVRRLRSALEDLISVAPEDRREPLRSQLDLLDAMSRAQAPTEADAEAIATPDRSGLGSAGDLVTSPRD